MLVLRFRHLYRPKSSSPKNSQVLQSILPLPPFYSFRICSAFSASASTSLIRFSFPLYASNIAPNTQLRQDSGKNQSLHTFPATIHLCRCSCKRIYHQKVLQADRQPCGCSTLAVQTMPRLPYPVQKQHHL